MPKQLKGKSMAAEELNDPRSQPESGRSPVDDLEYIGDLIDNLKSLAFEHRFQMLGEILRLALLEVQRNKDQISR